MATVYIETTIVSYLRQRPSSGIVMAAHQLLTHRWWNNERTKHELVVSQYVLDEAAGGDPTLAAERLRSLNGIPSLPDAPEIRKIAGAIMSRAILPQQAEVDALHIATAAHHRIDYLLTWNCRHIANARIQRRIHQILAEMNVPFPIMCTPEELLGDDTEIDT